LVDRKSVWVADAAEDFAAGVAALIRNREAREKIAQSAYAHAMRNFDWTTIGEKQRAALR
jgi:glycosyltransferase involved in cell wall biosynthesis